MSFCFAPSRAHSVFLSVVLLVTLHVSVRAQFTVYPTDEGSTLSGLLSSPKASKGRPKVGIVLSGGGSRGLAQIGVLRVLERHQIPMDLIVGTSLGSVVGALYASGYTVAELESIALATNWEEVLSFSENAKRTDLFIDQKQFDDAGFLVIRFEGLQPIIPSAISGGQRLSDFFMNLTLQALYHPDPSFDDLKIPFRAVATDLIRGKQIVIDRGPLAEALRASVTVPLLYSPLDKDSMKLVDGGLMSNIPVDVARSLGCDIVVVANSTAGLRRQDQLGAPWEVADQIMTIMMQTNNEIQLGKADVVISPVVGERTVADFSGVDSLIAAGEMAAESMIGKLLALIKERSDDGDSVHSSSVVRFAGDSIPAAMVDRIRSGISTSGEHSVRDNVTAIAATGDHHDVYAEVGKSENPEIVYHARINPVVTDVRLEGIRNVRPDSLAPALASLKGSSFNARRTRNAFEHLLRFYRKRQYSLARIDSAWMDSTSGIVHIAMNEGIIADIGFEGNVSTKDYVIRREFPLEAGDVFNLNEAQRGMVNIASTGLFEYVLMDVRYRDNRPYVVLKVKEKSTELVSVGLHADNERGFVSTVYLRDANFRGAGDDLSLRLRYGLRDRGVRLSYRASRIFHTYLAFNVLSYYRSRDIFTYRDNPNRDPLRWDRIENGSYRDVKYGGSLTFGSQVERFGNLTAELRVERQRIEALTAGGYDPESHKFVAVKLQSTIDTEDQFSFSTKGILLNISYESALKNLGSDVSFSKIGIEYESYLTIMKRHTIRPRVVFGFADETLPLSEQYSLGGFTSFMGLRDDDSRGRQLFVASMKYRYKLPFAILFDSYLRVRYDLGTISEVPEELKLSSFRHGIGADLAIDTPIGPAAFGAGVSFFLRKTLPESRISTGPILFYFSLGPHL